MEQTLLNEIVARVAAKLAEAEGGEAASAAASRDDREGLLLLSQEMNDTCRAMLKCEKLKARFRVDCASLQSEPAELDSYGVVVLTGLTNEALAKLALGLCDTPYTRLAAQAILTGKRVYVPTEEVELYRYASTAPAAYYAMMKERLDLLLTSGVVVCSKHNLEGLLLGGAACEAAPAEAPAAAEPSAPAPMPAAREEKLVHVTKRVLTERDIRDAAAEKVTCIHVPAKCILTALAKDCAKEHYLFRRAQLPMETIRHQTKSACIQCRMCTDLCPRYLIGHQIRPNLVMRNLWREGSIEDNEEYLRSFGDAANCCDCGVCEMFACPMGLSPRKVNGYIKGELRKRGIQVPRNMEPHAREFVDERKTPTDRLVARLGLSAYYGLHAHTCIPLEPETVFIPFQQHIGKPAVPVKAVGDPVAKGELLAQAAPDGLSANIHASIDGVVTEITPAGARLCRKEV